MQTIHLHIGIHKTGTTSVQAFLAGQQRALAAHGVLYPLSARTDSTAHHNLAWEVLEDPRFDGSRGGWCELVGEIEGSPCDHALVSAEDLCRLQPESIARVAERIDRFEVRVIVYLRRQDYLLEGFYTNAIRGGTTHLGFDTFFDKRRHSPRLDFDALLRGWESVFGRDRIQVETYDRDFDAAYDSIAPLLLCPPLVACPGLSREPTEGRLNEAPGLKTLELVRQLNHAYRGGELDAEGHRAARAVALERARRLGWDEERFVGLAEEASADLLEQVRAGNARVARDYRGRADGALFSSDTPAASGRRLRGKEREEIRELLNELLASPPAAPVPGRRTLRGLARRALRRAGVHRTP